LGSWATGLASHDTLWVKGLGVTDRMALGNLSHSPPRIAAHTERRGAAAGVSSGTKTQALAPSLCFQSVRSLVPSAQFQGQLSVATEDRLVKQTPKVESASSALPEMPLPEKATLKTYTAEDVLQNPLNKAARALIKYGYQWPTRSPDSSLSRLAQHTASGKCACCILSTNPLSCSEYGYRSFEVMSAPWALALTALKVTSCNPLTADTPVASLFDNPLKPSEFLTQARKLLQENPLIDVGTAKDWQEVKASFTSKEAWNEVWQGLKAKLSGKEAPEVSRSAFFDQEGYPSEKATALLNLNPRRWYFRGLKLKATPARVLQAGDKLNPHAIG
jgi:hypothetical protein